MDLTMLSGLAGLGAGVAAAGMAGPLACAWPDKGQAMLRRLKAVRTWRRPGAIRTLAGAGLLAVLMAGGALTAYAAAPSRPAPVAAAPVTLAVLTPAKAAPARQAAPSQGASPVPVVLAALETQPATTPAPGLRLVSPEPGTDPGIAPPGRLAVLINSSDSDPAGLRARILSNQVPPQLAHMPDGPTLVGPLSVYVPKGANAAAVIAQAFADPRGTWGASVLDDSEGRIFTRTSSVAVIQWPSVDPAPDSLMRIWPLPRRPLTQHPELEDGRKWAPAPGGSSRFGPMPPPIPAFPPSRGKGEDGRSSTRTVGRPA